MKQRIGLVLEGGGVRGAYTAGALAWLQDHQIHFDYSVGIFAAICAMMNIRRRTWQRSMQQIPIWLACMHCFTAAITWITARFLKHIFWEKNICPLQRSVKKSQIWKLVPMI